MATNGPTPNEALNRLHRDTGWTLNALARAVNLIGTERGTPRTYSASTVHAWLKGHVPKEDARSLIVEALARKLGRRITYAESGFPAPVQGQSKCSIVEELIDLGSQDMERRNFLGASLFSVVLTIPDWPDVVDRMKTVQASAKCGIGTSDVDLVKKMTDSLSVTYDDCGGRHTRPLAAAFIVNTVSPLLQADGPAEVRKAMMSAAAFLCYLTGWMAVDEGLQGLAQRYYVKGLQLAGASGDRMTYCHILRGVSVQAVDLGHGPLAVRLANAAADTSPKTGSRMRAFMAGQQAHSFAVAGDKGNALSCILDAERAMDKAESVSSAFGGYDPATLAYHAAQVRYGLGDVAGSVESLKQHFKLRRPEETRRSALRFQSMIAERQLEIGQLEAACETWKGILEEYPSVHSGKVDRHVASIGRRLRPHRSNSAARNIFDLALEVRRD
ncbi:tol-pal system YbgF family protein [Streptomyces sp. NPDC020965]|uniref:tol-pal system YbgF family protein n=1 Tax=Streptomyces sp. NPDC020965 TaxID=3365105 RepID=UPI0037AEC2ED